ncbi:NAD(P)-binding protein [Neoconidiobolus thromboides FSU 785]|nr:NAD(P)-binding protein [Neoconidiobolus thromboides FSU 785]
MDFTTLFTSYGWEFLICFILFTIAIPLIAVILSFLVFQIGLLLPINKKKVEGRHILVIGASQGLGKSLAISLSKLGASRITLSARGTDFDEKGLSRLDYAVEECKANADIGIEIEGLKMDVTNPEKVNESILKLVERVGKVDWVVISSGRAQLELFNHEKSHLPKNERSMMDLNYFGPVNVVRSLLLLGDTKGKQYYPERIISVGSLASCCPMSGSTAYGASKTALRAFFENLRNESCFYPNVKLHHFLPGAIDSPGFEVENLTKPKVTRAIEGSVDTITSDYAATCLLKGITRENYNICSDYIGFMARALSNGLNPREQTILDIFASPFYTLLGEILYRHFDSVACSEAKTHN